jgi:hypothetical protein
MAFQRLETDSRRWFPQLLLFFPWLLLDMKFVGKECILVKKYIGLQILSSLSTALLPLTFHITFLQ